jgi:hypothetical protein
VYGVVEMYNNMANIWYLTPDERKELKSNSKLFDGIIISWCTSLTGEKILVVFKTYCSKNALAMFWCKIDEDLCLFVSPIHTSNVHVSISEYALSCGCCMSHILLVEGELDQEAESDFQCYLTDI